MRARARRPWLGWGAAAALILAALSLPALACNGTSEPGESGQEGTTGKEVEGTLRQMVLQPEDLPPGLQRVDEKFTTNEELIALSADPDAKRAEVELWGRTMGYETTFLPGPDASPGTAVLAISASSSLYETAEGAALSLVDGRKTVDETDWQAARPDLQQLRAQRIERGRADEVVWLRLSGLSTSPERMVVEDLIIFRVGSERGFLRVAAAAPGQNRDFLLDEVEVWLTTQVQRVKNGLGAGVEP